MSKASGYTRKEAAQLKGKLDLELAKIDNAAGRLRNVVTDADPDRYTEQGIQYLLDEFAAVGDGLSEVINRRTRK